jgi:hypothetical protein
MPMKPRLGRAVTLVAAFLSVSCQRSDPVAESRQLAGSLYLPSTPREPRSPDETAPRQITLVVDGSMSMAGYVTCTGTATEFSNVLDRTAAALGLANVSIFGEQSGKPLLEVRTLGRDVHCPGMYTRIQNPDYRLLEIAAADTLTVVYFTDGVQSSASHGTPSPSMVAMENWLAAGGEIAILAFRSTFIGFGWSERNNAMIGRVSVDDRPFYVFIFTPAGQTVDGVLHRLPPQLVERATRIAFRNEPVRCEVKPAQLVIASSLTPPWSALPAQSVTQAPTQPVPVGSVQCSMTADFPLRRVQATVVPTAYYAWDGDRYVSVPLPAGYRFTIDRYDTATASIAEIDAVLPMDARLYGFYSLEITPRPGSLRPELEELSTDDDSNAESFDRTYRFGWLLDYLVRGQFDAFKVTYPYFLTLEYRR